ncbi:MAG: DUF2304 domain-containing protein [Spirochaetia bacterium]|nr:DUF2304 domain-containing protein [Spirochaetia bacterium]
MRVVLLQWIIVILNIGFILFIARHFYNNKVQAIKRLFFYAIFAVITLAFFFPNFFNRIAQIFGVGRGVDLIFYISMVLVSYLTVGFYIRFRVMNLKVDQLARQIAILEGRITINKNTREKK